ncbi:MAG: nucleolar complex protein 14 [Thelocarpon superellum]|nr:MAG: nucleolar complex protein 14 [Thelocarpon superellum]
MPASQLKRLKASLRSEGIVGPQPSKKQKKKLSQSDGALKDRARRGIALQNIREQFNPFEVQAPARERSKFDVTSNRTLGGRVNKVVKARPGVTKGLGEETRRRTLLTEMQRRKKVGGLLDRRFGENDPKMTPEERMLERFTQEKQRTFKKGALFDLEDDEEEGMLTHGGQALALGDSIPVDDFDATDLPGSEDDEDALAAEQMRKRRRLDASGASENEQIQDGEEDPDRIKSKAEVMKEVIAKSKFHKYERQQVKEDDEDEREKLDQELPEILALMRGFPTPRPTPPASSMPLKGAVAMNPERAALLVRQDPATVEKEYDLQVKQLALDKRSRPTERTMTEEERADDEARRLRELEEQRLRRMRGEDDEDESGEGEELGTTPLNAEVDVDEDNAETFGLGRGIAAQASRQPFDVEGEDEFVMDDDLIGSDPDVSKSEGDDVSDEDGLSEVPGMEDEDESELVRSTHEHDDKELKPDAVAASSGAKHSLMPDLAYTYPCPQTHKELLEVTLKCALEDLPVVVQRIRALHHSKLHSDNKAKLGRFAATLVDHISYLPNLPTRPSFSVLETLIRHIHSLAKAHAEEVGRAFRARLQDFHQIRPLNPTPGDLVILTAICSIFPTSDQFHHVVTPAALCMARYLGQTQPTTLPEVATGTYLATLFLQYQAISKRYVPEVITYVLNGLCILAPVAPPAALRSSPRRDAATPIRIDGPLDCATRSLHFFDILPREASVEEDGILKVALLETQASLMDAAAELWAGKPAFIEAFEPVSEVLQHLDGRACRGTFSKFTQVRGITPYLPSYSYFRQARVVRTKEKIQRLLASARTSRRPLALHHHRPQAIKTSIPRFEEGYNLDRHYDPDRERSDMSKLRAEHKRERKGALRELRKDANFVARESLREKKERDREYEKKFKRLVAEIQGEEGRESKVYEREKRARKGRK